MSATQDKLAIGVDVGGTNIRAAIVTSDGKTGKQNHAATPQDNGQLAKPIVLLQVIADCVRHLLGDERIIGVGVGCGGQFNPLTGVMLGTHTDHPDFVNVPFAARLNQALNIPVFVDNDVKAAALAELRIGAGRGYRNIVFVAVGTFIGGAIALDGRLVNGTNGLAGHIGQLVDFHTGEFVEAVAGGVPMGQRAVTEGILQAGQTTEDLFAIARTGSTQAQQFIANTGRALGFALAGVAHLLQPDVILVGGSVGVQLEYLTAINTALEEKLMRNWQHIRALPMQTGTEAGRVGAGLRVFDEMI